LVVFVGGLIASNVRNAVALETPLGVDSLACTHLEPLWLQAQAVPSASQVPCVRSLPVGWTLANVAVNDGRSVLTLNHDRAGKRALVVRLTAACDPGGAVEGPSPTEGVRHSQRIESSAGGGFSATWFGPVPGRLRHLPIASDDRSQRGVRRPGAAGAGVHHPRGAARGRITRPRTDRRERILGLANRVQQRGSQLVDGADHPHPRMASSRSSLPRLHQPKRRL